MENKFLIKTILYLDHSGSTDINLQSILSEDNVEVLAHESMGRKQKDYDAVLSMVHSDADLKVLFNRIKKIAINKQKLILVMDRDWQGNISLELIENLLSGKITEEIYFNGILLTDSHQKISEAELKLLSQGFSLIHPVIKSKLNNHSIVNFKPSLSQRELEILDLLVEGKTNKEIAYEYNISVRTVKFHVSSILEKTNCQSRTEAVVWALRNGRGAI